MIDHTPSDPRVFVFGSNLKGIHGAGAAKYAYDFLGAQWGKFYGMMYHSRGSSFGVPRCFAIPTCSSPGVPLPLTDLRKWVDLSLDAFVNFPTTQFYISKIGCGYAGYSEFEIAPLFANAPENCDLPEGWQIDARMKK